MSVILDVLLGCEELDPPIQEALEENNGKLLRSFPEVGEIGGTHIMLFPDKEAAAKFLDQIVEEESVTGKWEMKALADIYYYVEWP